MNLAKQQKTINARQNGDAGKFSVVFFAGTAGARAPVFSVTTFDHSDFRNYARGHGRLCSGNSFIQMKIPAIKTLLATAGWLALASVPILAQTGAPQTPLADIPLRAVVPGDLAQSAPPVYELVAKWNDRGGNNLFTVPFKNDFGKPLQVLGVQATGGIFITDYPGKVAGKKAETIAFVYNAADNTDGDFDVIRLLTNFGVRDIHVKIAREEAVQFDARELRWSAGGAADTKTVTLTLAAGTVTPVRARATGGHQAVLEAVNATTWRVKITPGSTAKSGQFAVFVDFDKALPGKAAVILGVIQPRE